MSRNMHRLAMYLEQKKEEDIQVEYILCKELSYTTVSMNYFSYVILS